MGGKRSKAGNTIAEVNLEDSDTLNEAAFMQEPPQQEEVKGRGNTQSAFESIKRINAPEETDLAEELDEE